MIFHVEFVDTAGPQISVKIICGRRTSGSKRCEMREMHSQVHGSYEKKLLVIAHLNLLSEPSDVKETTPAW